jgi:hypothetical protein
VLSEAGPGRDGVHVGLVAVPGDGELLAGGWSLEGRQADALEAVADASRLDHRAAHFPSGLL